MRIQLNNYTSYTDLQLLSLLSKSDKDAFNTLYVRHWADLYKNAFYILRNNDACKDIVQDIFVWLWQHREGLEINSIKSYLKAAVKFKVANYIRSGKIRDSFFDEIKKLNLPSTYSNPEDIAEINDLHLIVQQAICDLPPKCREVFKLSRDEHLSNLEIANRLNISVKTVENQMTIALRRIRTAVEPYMVSLLILSIINLQSGS